MTECMTECVNTREIRLNMTEYIYIYICVCVRERDRDRDRADVLKFD